MIGLGRRSRRDGRAAAGRCFGIARGAPLVERNLERCRRFTQRHAILRPARTRDVRHDVGQIERERVAEARLNRIFGAEHPLRFGIGFDERDLLGTAAGETQVRQRLIVDREHRNGRAVLGRHVADRRAVGDRQIGESRTVELDELPDHALLAQHLRDLQNQVGGGDAFAQLAGELEPNDLRNQHRHRLAEHGRLGLDTTDAQARMPTPSAIVVCESVPITESDTRSPRRRGSFARAARAEDDAA